MDERLTDGQRRAISSGLLIVDAAAVRMLDLLENRSLPASMSVIEGTVSLPEREQIHSRLEQLQVLIREFVQKYDLQPARRNIRRILAADASQIWVTLEDCRPVRIRGYGAMPPAQAESLEADLSQMLLIASWLRGLLST
ncbi:MAG TPA: hypothetical protein VEI26_08710 [Terriglobales bacterium]|nr:hypothetical protein [Terriglobales bacterium]